MIDPIEPDELRLHLLAALEATTASLPSDQRALSIVRVVTRMTLWRLEHAELTGVPKPLGYGFEDAMCDELAKLLLLPEFASLGEAVARAVGWSPS